jgi:CHAT domain-containing protein/lipopolysaccharide biosynthesis regulator YciM
MRATARVKRGLLGFTILMGALLGGVPEPVVGQANPPLTAEQSAELEEAKRLNQQAVQLYNQGQYAAAIPLAERALAIRQQALELEHRDVATSLNNLAALYQKMGNYQKAELLLQRSLAIREKVLGQEHPDVAQSLNNLAALYQKMGNYQKAEPLYQRSLAIGEKVLGQEHPDVAASLNNLAALYRDMGDYQRAEPLLQRSLAIREKALGLEHPDVATSLNSLAELYRKMGNYQKAEPLYQRSLAIGEKVLGQEHPDVAASLNNLAALYRDMGNYQKAEPLYQRSLAIWEKALGQKHPLVAISLNNLAAMYQEMGDYQRAEPLYQRSLAIGEKVLGQEHPDVAASLNNLAALYRDMGNYQKAEPLYQRSLAIWEKALGQKHPLVAQSLNNLAGLYKDMGDYQKAEPLYQRSLAIKEKTLGQKHPDVATSLNNLAGLYLNMGNNQKAEPLYQRSLAILEKALGLEHPDVAISLNNLALLYQAQGDIARALEFLNRGSNIQESNLALILTIGSEAQKSAYIATLSGKTDSTVSLHVQAAPNNPQATRLALTTVLQRKGRVLDSLTDSLQTLRQNLKPEDQTLLDQLATTRSQLSALIFKPVDHKQRDQYRQQVGTLKAQADELEATLSRRSAAFRTKSQPVTLEAIQPLIPADAALVELALYKPFNPKATKRYEGWGNPRYVAYILHSTGEPKWVDLGEAEPINQAATDFRKALQSDSSNVKPVARTLDEKLMQPIRKLLGNTRNVLLSPDSQLNLIPFAALVDENNRYLVENYSINYLSSGRDLLRLQNHAKSRSESVIVANPDYDKPGDPTSVAIISRGESSQIAAAQPINLSTKPAQTRGVLDSDRIQQLEFTALSYTEQEAKAISPMLPGATLLTGSQATENAIKQLQAPTILHIATHGFFLQDVPLVAPPDFSSTILQGTRSAIPNVRPTENPLLRSGLALAGANPRKSGNEDGILTALEAAGLNLSGTKLLVLSACKTGLGDVQNGEGVYGLRRAFAIAGAESQLMSLWAVNDYRTNHLMVNYYQRLKNNVGRSEALRQTQLEMLQKPESQHPYYWAAFIPSGDWTPMGSP